VRLRAKSNGQPRVQYAPRWTLCVAAKYQFTLVVEAHAGDVSGVVSMDAGKRTTGNCSACFKRDQTLVDAAEIMVQ
jgi:hypothetical protein